MNDQRSGRSPFMTDLLRPSDAQVRPALNQPRTQTEVPAANELLATLGNETRYGLLNRIAQGEDCLSVCEIEAPLGVSQGAVSQGLSKLSRAGLVERENQGRWRYHSTSERAIRLLRILDDVREFDAA